MQECMGYWTPVKPSWISHRLQYNCELHETYSCLGDISVITSWRERDWQPHHLGLLLWNLHKYLREKHMVPVTPNGSFPSSAFFSIKNRIFFLILCQNKPVVCKWPLCCDPWLTHWDKCLQQPDKKDLGAVWAAHLARCCISATKRA